jgi:2-polyprenyl-6-hydroxyphenyl methylase/3-demethylubiquinone-9 3-methyltransferase
MTHASANVDHAEISKFEALAARWWDPDSEFKTLHDINPLRLAFIERKIKLAGARVLDVGCGGGILSEAMAARGAVVTGIDMGEMPLRIAELHTLESGVQVEYRRAAAESLAEECPGQFDLITCMELLEHVPQPASVVRACAELARPGGHLVFSTLNRNPKSYLFAVLGAEYLLNMLPRGTHDYARFLRPSELARFARDAGLRLDEISGMTYNPLTRVYKLDPKDISVNYLLSCEKPA